MIKDSASLPPSSITLTPNTKIHPRFHDFDVDMSVEANNTKSKIKLNILFPTEYKLFTDGSKTDKGVGCAVYDSHTDKAKLYKLERFSSIYTAETLAILFCLHSIETLNTTATKFLICSGSGRTVSLSTLSILQILYAKGKSVTLIWVKGHSGCEGNTIADK